MGKKEMAQTESAKGKTPQEKSSLYARWHASNRAWLIEKLQNYILEITAFFFLSFFLGALCVLFFQKDDKTDTAIKLFAISGGVIGIGLALWRSNISEKQVATAQQQAQIAQLQLQTQQRSQIEDIFSRAVEQLGNSNLSIRQGGIASLAYLIDQNSEMAERCWDVLGGFLRDPSDLAGWKRVNPPKDWQNLPGGHSNIPFFTTQGQEELLPIGQRPDIDAVAQILQKPQKWKVFRLPLRWAQLAGAYLRQAKLQKAFLIRAQLQKADLGEAQLQDAIFAGAELQGADLENAVFANTDISLCDFSDAQNLTEEQLNGCFYSKIFGRKAPPILPPEFRPVEDYVEYKD